MLSTFDFSQKPSLTLISRIYRVKLQLKNRGNNKTKLTQTRSNKSQLRIAQILIFLQNLAYLCLDLMDWSLDMVQLWCLDRKRGFGGLETKVEEDGRAINGKSTYVGFNCTCHAHGAVFVLSRKFGFIRNTLRS